MRSRLNVFIFVAVIASLATFLSYNPDRLAPVGGQISRFAEVQQALLERVLPAALDRPSSQTEKPGSKPDANPAALAQTVRVPAIRDAHNYGWIQLPRGTEVDLVEEQRDGFLIRYEECYLVVPRSAVDGSSVVLRKRGANSAS